MAKLEFANALRGLAALSVVTSHYNSFFFGSAALIGTMANIPPPVRVASSALDAWQAFLLLFPISGGEFGVGLFFLISGFVIPMSLQKYDWRGFLVGRILRIYPTYFAGFGVTLIALWMAGSTFGRPFPFEARSVLIHFVPGARDLLWSVDIDYVVWTLEIEIKFYILCAIAWKWIRLGDRSLFAIPLAMACCAIGIEALLAGWLRADGFAYRSAFRLGYHVAMTLRFLGFMFIGVAIYYHYRRRIGTVGLCAIASMLFSGFWIEWRMSPYSDDTLSMQVVNSYTLALLVFCASYAFSTRWPTSRILAFFADISYPLYVVHGVAGYVALGIMVAHGVGPIAALGFTLAGALLVSSLLHAAVELPTHRLGQRLARAMTRPLDDRSVPPSSSTHG